MQRHDKTEKDKQQIEDENISGTGGGLWKLLLSRQDSVHFMIDSPVGILLSVQECVCRRDGC